MATASVLGWATAGFFARCYQLGLQKRHIFENFVGHAGFMVAFGAFGYWMHGIEERQVVLIKQKREEIERNREKRDRARQKSRKHEEEEG